jgi:hypothetical protein
MTAHECKNRIVAPLVFAAVVGCVWYGLASRPQPIAILPTQQASAAPTHTHTKADQAPVADVTPTVSKLGDQLQFSVDTTSFKTVQKVEYYVENLLVGAAFSAPYAVSVDEDDLTAGTHTVTAKVYTASATAQSTPALFTAAPKAVPPVSTDTDDSSTVAQITTPNKAIAAPSGLSIAADDSGTLASLTWNSVSNASSYQVWRDGAQIDTTTTASYTDTGLTPGQTYDYSVVAVAADGQQSAASSQVAVTTPTPSQQFNHEQSQNTSALPSNPQDNNPSSSL